MIDPYTKRDSVDTLIKEGELARLLLEQIDPLSRAQQDMGSSWPTAVAEQRAYVKSNGLGALSKGLGQSLYNDHMPMQYKLERAKIYVDTAKAIFDISNRELKNPTVSVTDSTTWWKNKGEQEWHTMIVGGESTFNVEALYKCIMARKNKVEAGNVNIPEFATIEMGTPFDQIGSEQIDTIIRCPLSGQAPVNPVIFIDGYVYDGFTLFNYLISGIGMNPEQTKWFSPKDMYLDSSSRWVARSGAVPFDFDKTWLKDNNFTNNFAVSPAVKNAKTPAEYDSSSSSSSSTATKPGSDSSNGSVGNNNNNSNSSGSSEISVDDAAGENSSDVVEDNNSNNNNSSSTENTINYEVPPYQVPPAYVIPAFNNAAIASASASGAVAPPPFNPNGVKFNEVKSFINFKGQAQLYDGLTIEMTPDEIPLTSKISGNWTGYCYGSENLTLDKFQEKVKLDLEYLKSQKIISGYSFNGIKVIAYGFNQKELTDQANLAREMLVQVLEHTGGPNVDKKHYFVRSGKTGTRPGLNATQDDGTLPDSVFYQRFAIEGTTSRLTGNARFELGNAIQANNNVRAFECLACAREVVDFGLYGASNNNAYVWRPLASMQRDTKTVEWYKIFDTRYAIEYTDVAHLEKKTPLPHDFKAITAEMGAWNTKHTPKASANTHLLSNSSDYKGL